MKEMNEYARVLQYFYEKSLILENLSDFHPVMKFWYYDAVAHLDYSISLLAYNGDSPRNLITMDYLKYHTQESKAGDYALFPGFMKWLSANHPEEYERFPLFIQKIYDPEDKASYRSFKIILNPDENRAIPAQTFQIMVDELFDKSYLAALYKESGISKMFEEYKSR